MLDERAPYLAPRQDWRGPGGRDGSGALMPIQIEPCDDAAEVPEDVQAVVDEVR